ncbi:hypothetical protein VDGE_30060 [Verticillium dahliae]|uniref:Uncharacterized protein n=1 Tax=Verticillium dahliae TaxID=27337 RepID=A0A444RQJ6_VERDA|nr:hypothetical protein VDGE_30060 [Verticillium dahliae]
MWVPEPPVSSESRFLSASSSPQHHQDAELLHLNRGRHCFGSIRLTQELSLYILPHTSRPENWDPCTYLE